jgi:hypothetical protein
VAELLAAIPEAAISHTAAKHAFAASYSTGVMMPMGFEFGWSRALDVVATGTAEPSQTLISAASSQRSTR